MSRFVLCCPVWWDRVVCLLEWELWCFNELKGLLILNLITLLPASRLLALTLIVIYGSSTLCFLINHLLIDGHPVLHSSLSLLSKELSVYWAVTHRSFSCRSELCFHSYSVCYTTTCASEKKEFTELLGMGKLQIKKKKKKNSHRKLTDSRVKQNWHTDSGQSVFPMYKC